MLHVAHKYRDRLAGLFFPALFLLTACGSVPQPSFYALNIPENTGRNARSPIPVRLGIERFESGILYSDDRLIYRDSEFEVKHWNYQHWVAPPHILIPEYLQEYLRTREIFEEVVSYPLNRQVQYVLSGKVLSFEERYTPDGLIARVGFEAKIIDLRGGETIWKNEYNKEVPIPEKSIISIVAAMSDGIRLCFEGVVEDIRKDLDTKLSVMR